MIIQRIWKILAIGILLNGSHSQAMEEPYTEVNTTSPSQALNSLPRDQKNPFKKALRYAFTQEKGYSQTVHLKTCDWEANLRIGYAFEDKMLSTVLYTESLKNKGFMNNLQKVELFFKTKEDHLKTLIDAITPILRIFTNDEKIFEEIISSSYERTLSNIKLTLYNLKDKAIPQLTKNYEYHFLAVGLYPSIYAGVLADLFDDPHIYCLSNSQGTNDVLQWESLLYEIRQLVWEKPKQIRFSFPCALSVEDRNYTQELIPSSDTLKDSITVLRTQLQELKNKFQQTARSREELSENLYPLDHYAKLKYSSLYPFLYAPSLLCSLLYSSPLPMLRQDCCSFPLLAKDYSRTAMLLTKDLLKLTETQHSLSKSERKALEEMQQEYANFSISFAETEAKLHTLQVELEHKEKLYKFLKKNHY